MMMNDDALFARPVSHKIWARGRGGGVQRQGWLSSSRLSDMGFFQRAYTCFNMPILTITVQYPPGFLPLVSSLSLISVVVVLTVIQPSWLFSSLARNPQHHQPHQPQQHCQEIVVDQGPADAEWIVHDDEDALHLLETDSDEDDDDLLTSSIGSNSDAEEDEAEEYTSDSDSSSQRSTATRESLTSTASSRTTGPPANNANPNRLALSRWMRCRQVGRQSLAALMDGAAGVQVQPAGAAR
jgi:hypothetical protein